VSVRGSHRRRRAVPGTRHVAARSVLAVAVLLSAMLVYRPTWAAFSSATSNASTASAAATFPAYPPSVTADGPWGYYRGEETASGAATSTAADSSGSARTGTYAGRTDGPTTRWSFDENTGTIVRDASGAVNTGTVANAAPWTTGVSGSALSFNGTNQYVDARGPAVVTDASFTVTGWVYLAFKGANRTVISQDGTNVGGFFLQYDTSRDRFALVRWSSDGNTGTATVAAGTTSPSLNRWYHLAAVYDRTNQRILLYVNGKLESNVAFTSPWKATGKLAVGRSRWLGANADFWAGRIDDVRTYRRALPAADVALLAGNGVRAAYHFSEGSGTTAGDGGPLRNDATLNGGVGWTGAGRIGTGVSFNGSSGAVTGPAAVLATNSSFSVAAWVYLSNKSDYRTAVSQDGNSISAFWLQYNVLSDKWAFTMRGGDSTDAPVYWAMSTSTPAVNTWTHLTGVYDDAAGEMKLYVNGTLAATTAFTGNWQASGALMIGGDLWGGGRQGYWAGNLDEVYAFQRTLSAAEVGALYGGTAPATVGTDPPITAQITGALQGAQQGQAASTAIAFGGAANAHTTNAQTAPAAFTAECWFRTDSVSGGVLVGFADTRTGTAASYDRQIYLDSGGRLTFGTRPAGATTPRTVRSPAAYNDRAWHHVAGTLGAAGLRLYVDGVLVASDTATKTAGAYSGYWRWGASTVTSWPNPPASGFFTGTIDEVAVYSSQLSAQQISRHFHADH
jgi:Concanavalin A-like lectin/glucanases superfamily